MVLAGRGERVCGYGDLHPPRAVWHGPADEGDGRRTRPPTAWPRSRRTTNRRSCHAAGSVWPPELGQAVPRGELASLARSSNPFLAPTGALFGSEGSGSSTAHLVPGTEALRAGLRPPPSASNGRSAPRAVLRADHERRQQFAACSQLTIFQNASTNFGRALR